MRILVAILVLGWAACGGQDGDVCAGVVCAEPPAERCKDGQTLLEYPDLGSCEAETGECRYPPTERACPQGCRGGACVEPESFRLVIPEGVEVCSLFNGGFGAEEMDVVAEYPFKGRIALRQTELELSKRNGQFEADWIAQVEYGSERAVLAAAGPGRYTASLKGPPGEQYYEYELNQDFPEGARTLRVSYRFSLPAQGGAEEQRLDPEVTGAEFFDLTAELLEGSQSLDRRSYTLCGFPTYQLRFVHTVAIENGDSVVLDQRMVASVCKVCPSGMVEASFKRGATEREVTDPFRLAYTAGHHNWFQQFLIVLDQPLDDTYAILLIEGEIGKLSTARYLDQDLQLLHTLAVTQDSVEN